MKECINETIMEKYEFRNIRPEETDQVVKIEQICFPPNEACSEKDMKERILQIPDLFLVAVDKKTKEVSGFLNGLATDEDTFRDEFFTDSTLNDPEGKNIYLEMAYTHNLEDAEAFKKEVEAEFPGMEIVLNPLSLSVSCHIGPGALAVACSKKIPELLE